MKDFEFIIGSPFDKEKLICEIYYKDEIFGEISHESDFFEIEIYPHSTGEGWRIPLDQFIEAIKAGKEHLIGS